MTTTVLVSKPVRTLQAKAAITVRIMMAGIEANAHLTMKMTMDQNGIWMSATITLCMFLSLFIGTPHVSVIKSARI